MFPEGLVHCCQRKQPGPPWTGVLLAPLLFLCWGLRAGGGQDSSGGANKLRSSSNTPSSSWPFRVSPAQVTELRRSPRPGSVPAGQGRGRHALSSVPLGVNARVLFVKLPIRGACHILGIFRWVSPYLFATHRGQGVPTTCTGCSQTCELSVDMGKGLPGCPRLFPGPCLSRGCKAGGPFLINRELTTVLSFLYLGTFMVCLALAAQ